MKIDKRLLIGALAVAITAFAVSASSASAAVWKDHGTAITKSAEIGLTGGEVFEFEEKKSGMSCELHATMTLEVGSKGKITKFETKKCSGGFGKLAGCELASAEAKELPWSVDVNATDLTITNMHTLRKFKTGCPITELNKTIASATVTLLSPTAIEEMEFKGEVGEYISFGSFTVDGTNSGTYGIG